MKRIKLDKLFCSVLLTVSINLYLNNENNYSTINVLFELIGLYMLLDITSRKRHKKSVNIASYILGSIIALSTVVGYSFELSDSFKFVFGDGLHENIYGLMRIISYTVIFRKIIVLGYDIFDRFIESDYLQINNKYSVIFKKHPFMISFAILFIAYIPYIIASYPGILMGDQPGQIAQAYNVKSFHPYVNLISEDVKLFNHHPVTHTMLIHICIVIGKSLFGSYNVGLFIYSFLQLIITIAIYSVVEKLMVKYYDIDFRYSVLLLVYFIVHPVINHYMMLDTKDIYYTDFLLIFTFVFSRVIYDRSSINKIIVLFSSILGVLLFRNDGIYLILPTLLSACLLHSREIRKVAVILSVMTVCFYVAWNSIILPSLKITAGGKREMFSIPFQQTARYVRDYGGEVTEKEKKVISAVLDYESMAKKYDPNKADNVKNTFNEDATSDEFSQYIKTWWNMLLKHPKSYIESVVAMKYQYVFPCPYNTVDFPYSWSESMMERANDMCEEINLDIHYPEGVNGFRMRYEEAQLTFFKLPIINLLFSSAFYVWMTIIWAVYLLINKKTKALVTMIPFIMILIVCLMGPTNGDYIRYMYPYMVCLPIIGAIHIKEICKEKK